MNIVRALAPTFALSLTVPVALSTSVRSPDALRAQPLPSPPHEVADLGACNPRVEVCEPDVAGEPGSEDDAPTDTRRRGWLSLIDCNPRVRVCES